LERQLIGIDSPAWRSFEQAVDWPAVHEVCADKSGEGERALDRVLRGLGKAQEEEGDQSDGNLDSDRVLRGAEEPGDLEGLLDPAEEELNGPTAL